MQEYLLKRYHERRDFVIKHFGNKCIVEDCIAIREEHELFVCTKPGKKPFSKVFSLSERKFLDALDSFEVRCSIHKTDLNPKDITHGAYHAYYRRGCRCDDCCDWHANYILERREIRRDKRLD